MHAQAMEKMLSKLDMTQGDYQARAVGVVLHSFSSTHANLIAVSPRFFKNTWKTFDEKSESFV